jgi:hypothetical protein
MFGLPSPRHIPTLPLADIQPATLRHILQPHTGRAPPLAPAIRITAQTSRRVSGAIARTVLSPSSKLRCQPRPHRPSNHAVPLAEMRSRRTASPCESLRPHLRLARVEGSSLPQSPFQTERDWHEFLSGRPPHPIAASPDAQPDALALVALRRRRSTEIFPCRPAAFLAIASLQNSQAPGRGRC